MHIVNSYDSASDPILDVLVLIANSCKAKCPLCELMFILDTGEPAWEWS